MSRPTALPRHCLVVRRYDEFRRLIRAFGQETYDLVCIFGGPGLGKSEIVMREMQEARGVLGWGLIKGKHSPLDLYERLHRFRLVPVVLDDLDDLLKKSDCVTLLKCACETQPVKRIEWGSKHSSFKNQEDVLPTSFESISKVCLIANDWNSVNRNVAALQDRGLVISFQPTVFEVHKELARAGWFDDEEVFSFIGQHLFLVTEPSFRFYKIAQEHKKAGLDWRSLILRTIESEADPELILVARLLADPKYDAEPSPKTARAKAFASCSGKSRATYYRRRGGLLERRGSFDAEDVAEIKLQPCKPDLHRLALRDRFQQLKQMRDQVDMSAEQTADETETDLLSQVRQQLEKAVADEDYELAARLRDTIRKIEKGQEGQKH